MVNLEPRPKRGLEPALDSSWTYMVNLEPRPKRGLEPALDSSSNLTLDVELEHGLNMNLRLALNLL
jgi:hypothetical protein